MEEIPVIGLTEKIVVYGSENKKLVSARIDTGATKSSIDEPLARELELGPAVRTMLIRSTHGSCMRPVLKVRVNIAGKELFEEFTLANRGHMKYRVLIGQNILKKGFIIDPLLKK